MWTPGREHWGLHSLACFRGGTLAASTCVFASEPFAVSCSHSVMSDIILFICDKTLVQNMLCSTLRLKQPFEILTFDECVQRQQSRSTTWACVWRSMCTNAPIACRSRTPLIASPKSLALIGFRYGAPMYTSGMSACLALHLHSNLEIDLLFA